jgi:hypothetical protein
MANMNTKRTDIKVDTNTTVNHEGMTVHKLNALEEIMNRTLGSYMGEDGFYDKTSPEKDFDRIKELIDQVSDEDAEYILKIAAIGRETGMISYPLAVLTACYNSDKFKGSKFLDENGKSKFAGYTDLCVRRGRDITDILAMQMHCYGFDSNNGKRTTSIPMQERKNLNRNLEEFDEYKISKALGESRSVSMADAVKLLHPANKNEFFKQVIEGKVKFANGKKQVQSEMTKVNNKNSESTVQDLKESIKESSLLAIIKNLVGLYRKNAIDDEVTEIIVDKLSNSELVRKSKVMPYEIYNAYAMFKRKDANSIKISDALIKALDASVDNVDAIEGYSAIFVDLSSSMDSCISSLSSTTCMKMAALLAAIAVKKSCAKVYAFANRCKEVDVSSTSTVVDIMKKILSTDVGGCTYLMEALKSVRDSGEKFDNAIVLSDGDAYEYDARRGLVLGNRWGESGSNCDGVVNKLIKDKTIKRFFINNLSARDFTVVNTDDYRKNLVTGFTERYIDEINFSIMLQRESADVRKLIDALYDKYFVSGKTKKNTKKK